MIDCIELLMASPHAVLCAYIIIIIIIDLSPSARWVPKKIEIIHACCPIICRRRRLVQYILYAYIYPSRTHPPCVALSRWHLLLLLLHAASGECSSPDLPVIGQSLSISSDLHRRPAPPPLPRRRRRRRQWGVCAVITLVGCFFFLSSFKFYLAYNLQIPIGPNDEFALTQ